ncbi:MAG: magnesium chelatase ATPase subunit I [Bacteroidetes bacterium]|nr:magnesium chelatase ATPase subunit I [Bacteroidota bacterium]
MTNDSNIPIYPFVAIVGQEELKRALTLAAIEPAIGGVMIMGHRGTGKSTTVRALAGTMPRIAAVEGCAFNCAPEATAGLCERCSDAGKPFATTIEVPMVDLPLGATEDRVAGTIDIEHALMHGAKRFEPGLLARANRGFLYVDEVNLLEDHLVDLLLDVAASGINVVEREGISVRHPARFALVGSGNPEEGELRPQLLDRFGLHAAIETEHDIERRVEIIRRRMAFDDNPAAFIRDWQAPTEELRERIGSAQRSVREVRINDGFLSMIAALSAALDIDGHRGELVMTRAARANAALDGRDAVTADDVRLVAPMALRHRLRKDPLEMTDPGSRIAQAVEKIVME